MLQANKYRLMKWLMVVLLCWNGQVLSVGHSVRQHTGGNPIEVPVLPKCNRLPLSQPKAIHFPPTGGESLSWHDYSGDGQPDLMLSDNGRCRLFQREASGKMTELAATPAMEELFSSASLVADVNRDGVFDTVENNGPGRLIRWGGSHGNKAVFHLAFPPDTRLKDLQIDPRGDRLFVLEEAGDRILVFQESEGQFQLTQSIPFEAPVAGFTVGRLNPPGALDLVVTLENGNLLVCRGNESGMGSASHLPTGFPCGRQVEIAHFNADRFPDLVVNDNQGQIWVMLSLGNDAFSNPLLVWGGAGKRAWTMGAVNFDQVDDLIVLEEDGLFSLVAQPNATFTVTNTNDSGPGSLRQALLDAQTPGADVISFNIPTTQAVGGIFTITLTSLLPHVPQGTTINGDTQATVSNTNPNGPEIFINAGAVSVGLQLNSDSSVIRGLGILGANGAAIQLAGPGSVNNTIEGCYLGTNADASAPASKPNAMGIAVLNGANGNRIGGTSSTGRNIISGNLTAGISVQGTGTSNNSMQNNVVGLNLAATAGIPNGGGGIVLQAGASNNRIGGIGTNVANFIGRNNGGPGILLTGAGTNSNQIQGNLIGTNSQTANLNNTGDGIRIVSGASNNLVGGVNAGNTIAFNLGSGIKVGGDNTDTTTQGNTLSRNLIFSNTGLGIDLGNTGQTANDQNDIDFGPNGLINKPTITGVAREGTNLRVNGKVDALEGVPLTIELFANFTTPPSQQYLTSLPTTAGGSGFSVLVPAPTGTFTLTATATDAAGNTSEFSDPTMAGTQPDLTARSVSVTPTQIPAGESVTVSATLANSGSVNLTSPFSVGFVLSSDNVFDSTDTVLTRTMVTQPVAANASITLPSTKVLIPNNVRVGNQFIGVVPDIDNLVVESNETNNAGFTNLLVTAPIPPKPDLVIGTLTVSTPTVMLGGMVTVNLTLSNRSQTPVGNSVVQLVLSTDSVVSAGDTRIANINANGPGANGSLPVSATVMIPTNLPPGAYFLGATADSTLLVDETDESNNNTVTPLMVVGMPDLAVDSVSVQPATAVVSGATLTIGFTLRNQGNFMAGNSINSVVLSSDNQLGNSDDVLLGSRASESLAPGASVQVSLTVTLPTNAKVGPQFIGVIADAGGFVTEANETNNSGTTGLLVADQTAPTASFTNPAGEGAFATGRNLTIEWTASDNIGIATQELRYSTDGGSTFPNVITASLAPTARSFQWMVPTGIETAAARIQLLVKDAAGNVGTAVNPGNLTVGAPPMLAAPPKLAKSGKLVVTGTNIRPGAKLRITMGTLVNTLELSVKINQVIVPPTARSIPSGKTAKEMLPRGTVAVVSIINPNGITSDPVMATY